MTKDEKLLITLICIVTLTANSAYSSIAPFYPDEAVQKGVSKVFIGFIFSGYSLSMFIFAPVFSSMLTKHGRKNVLLLGCIFVIKGWLTRYEFTPYPITLPFLSKAVAVI